MVFLLTLFFYMDATTISLEQKSLREILKRLQPVLYLSAGGWGVVLNFLVTICLFQILQFPVLVAFSGGFFVNGFFNFWFSQVHFDSMATINHTNEVSYSAFFLLHLFLLGLGLAVLYILMTLFPLPLLLNLAITMSILSVFSLFLGRIWVFVSPYKAAIEYEALSEGFYEDSMKKEVVGEFRAWYHGSRYAEINKNIRQVYRQGMTVYDFGCGGSEWNSEHFPITGVDINKNLLEHGKKKGHLKGFIVKHLDDTDIPHESADLVILSEVLEHIPVPNTVLDEIYRILKPGGLLFLTVPWDTVISPFFWLFNAQCFYRGYLLGEEYYRQRCGHTHHFSQARLEKTLSEHGFFLKRSYIFKRLLIYTLSAKGGITSKNE